MSIVKNKESQFYILKANNKISLDKLYFIKDKYIYLNVKNLLKILRGILLLIIVSNINMNKEELINKSDIKM